MKMDENASLTIEQILQEAASGDPNNPDTWPAPEPWQ